jgi:hypothetical protein
VTTTDRDIAADLARDLIELAEVILASLESGPTHGPIVDETSKRLTEAISLLVTLVKP